METDNSLSLFLTLKISPVLLHCGLLCSLCPGLLLLFTKQIFFVRAGRCYPPGLKITRWSHGTALISCFQLLGHVKHQKVHFRIFIAHVSKCFSCGMDLVSSRTEKKLINETCYLNCDLPCFKKKKSLNLWCKKTLQVKKKTKRMLVLLNVY